MAKFRKVATRPPVQAAPLPVPAAQLHTVDEQLLFEVESFQHLREITWPTPLSAWNWQIHQTVKQCSQGVVRDRFTFEAYGPRASADIKDIVTLGMCIDPAEALISYSMLIARDRTILRRIHFDIEHTPQDEPKPRCHMHVGGRLDVAEEAMYDLLLYQADHLPGEDKPRIPCLPPSFVLLTHWALLEYQHSDPEIGGFISDAAWLNRVRFAELAILHRYFDRGHAHITRHHHYGESYLTGSYITR